MLRWPGNSPGMNPIEKVWECLKRELSKETITSKVQLVERIEYHWNHNRELEEITKKKFIHMPRRIDTFLKTKEGLTEY